MKKNRIVTLAPLCFVACLMWSNAAAGEASNPIATNVGIGEGTKSPAPKMARSLPNEITTRDGKTYKAVRVLSTDAGGLLVSFQPDQGGIGMAKLKFQSLNDGLREQFGYDPNKAAAFEEEQAKAQTELAAQMLADYRAATERIAARRASEEAEAAAAAAQARAAEEAVATTEALRQALTNEKDTSWEDGSSSDQSGTGYAWPIEDPDVLAEMRRRGLDPDKFVRLAPPIYQPPGPDGMYKPPVPDKESGLSIVPKNTFVNPVHYWSGPNSPR